MPAEGLHALVTLTPKGGSGCVNQFLTSVCTCLHTLKSGDGYALYAATPARAEESTQHPGSGLRAYRTVGQVVRGEDNSDHERGSFVRLDGEEPERELDSDDESTNDGGADDRKNL